MALFILSIGIIIGVVTIILWIFCFNWHKQILKIDTTIIKIARTDKECNKLIKQLKSYNPTIVGLDCEWSNNNKVSLLQIGHQQLTILIRLNLLDTIPSNLIDFLHDVTILKCGVGVFQDVNKLKNDYNIDVFGVVDLNHILKTLPINTINNLLSNKNIIYQTTLSLKSMSVILLNQSMQYKSYANNWRFHNNWNNKQLNNKQILYAADDALKGYQIFVQLMKLIDPTSEKSYLETCFGFIDTRKCKQPENTNKSDNKTQSLTLNNNNAKTLKNKNDALQYTQCYICGINSDDLIMFSIIPEQYHQFIVFNTNKYRVPICMNNCYKKCKINQNKFMNEIHEKHVCVMIPNKKLLTDAKIAAMTLSNNATKNKISPQLMIKLLKHICNYYSINCNIIYSEQDEKYDANIEHKWQYYDQKCNEFVDYDNEISMKIEKRYCCPKRSNHFLMADLR
eukprot:118658_1